MKKFVAFVVLATTFVLSANAQRVSTQQFLVREITFKATDQIVPVGGVSVEINKAKFRSDKTGQFKANIPVADDKGFYISAVVAPGYVVSIPEDLSKRVFLTANDFVIVLADTNAVKAERDRIRRNNQIALAKQEERLKEQVKKNEELLSVVERQKSEYNNVLQELEKAKRQLETFNNAKGGLAEKIDSLSENLAMVDYSSLGAEEKKQLELQKEGKWIDAVVDEVISKLETNLSDKYNKEIKAFEEMLAEISNSYYQNLINGNQAFAANYFAYHYGDYLYALLNELPREKSKIMDRLLDKVIEEDFNIMLEQHIDECKSKWEVKETSTVSNSARNNSARTLELAKKDFLEWAMYPDRENVVRREVRSYWDKANIDEGISNTLKKSFGNYYAECKKLADKQIADYKALSNEEIYLLFKDESYRDKLNYELSEVLRTNEIKITDTKVLPYYTFINTLNHIVEEETIDQLRTRYNELVDRERTKIANRKFLSIKSKIPALSQAKKHSAELVWEADKNIESYRAEYAKYEKDYPVYTAFLYPIVMEFMQPIIDKYDCDEALFTWKSSMESDVTEYCFIPIRNYSNKLSYVSNVPGSDDKCMDIVRAIINVEKDNIVKKHNDRIAKNNESKAKDEEAQIAKIKESVKAKTVAGEGGAKGYITTFTCEDDVVAFLAIHKFVNEDYEISSWYDSKISLWYMSFPSAPSAAPTKISYTIMEWNSNSAKVKIKTEGGGIIIVNVKLGSTSASYTESAGGFTREFKVVDK